jgi:hypothetical protein
VGVGVGVWHKKRPSGIHLIQQGTEI